MAISRSVDRNQLWKPDLSVRKALAHGEKAFRNGQKIAADAYQVKVTRRASLPAGPGARI